MLVRDSSSQLNELADAIIAVRVYAVAIPWVIGTSHIP